MLRVEGLEGGILGLEPDAAVTLTVEGLDRGLVGRLVVTDERDDDLAGTRVGLLPHDESTEDELNRNLLEGRVCEIRMLFLVGKDLLRWIAQCLDFVSSIPELQGAGICEQSFAEFLVQNPPEPVRAKLRGWGVFDYKSIFSRAIGLNAVFCAPPDESQVSSDFIRNYFRYADHMFACRQQMQAFSEVTVDNFTFDIYASGEYSRILEKSWGE